MILSTNMVITEVAKTTIVVRVASYIIVVFRYRFGSAPSVLGVKEANK